MNLLPSIFFILLQAATALLLAPFLLSVIAKTKALFAGRVGPPWLQPYYELAKLLQKNAVYSQTTTWVFRAGPVVSLASMLTAATIIPILSGQSWFGGFPGDLILVAYLFALARMFTILAALDTGSSFEGMGAAREATFGMMAEPAFFLSLATIAVATKSLQLSTMLGPALDAAWINVGPAMILVLGALLVVLLAECSRIPVDDPATHLELTMIHEVMVLDHSGPDLAFILYSASLKFLLLASILLHAAFPVLATLGPAAIPLWVAGLLLLAALVGTIESVMARLRLNRVPLLLASASALAALAVLLVLAKR